MISHPRRRPRLRRSARHRRRRRRLPDPSGHPDRRLHAGRAERRARPHRRAPARKDPRPDLRDRQPAGRRRQHRRRDRRPCGARRLHAADGQQRAARHQPEPVQEAQLRRREGFRADQPDRLAAQHPGGQSEVPGDHHGGADRLREGQSGQAQLRQFRLRRRRASLGGAVQVRGQGRHRVGVLQGRGAGAAGPDRRPHPGDVRDLGLGGRASSSPARCGRSR